VLGDSDVFSIDILGPYWYIDGVKIKFLRNCQAPQARTRFCCEMCGHIPAGMEMTDFWKDEEADPEFPWDNRIDLSGLKFNEDYIITEYP